MNQSTLFSNFMKNHQAQKGQEITHTRIGDKESGIFGGAYHIPDDEYEEFMKLYYKNTFHNGKLEYLTEKQLIENSPIMIDVDFRYEKSIDKRQHTPSHRMDLVMLYADKIEELVILNNDVKVDVFVMEKGDVNMLNDKTKDGIHIIIGIKMHKAQQVWLREEVIKEIPNMWEDLPLTNTWDDVFDLGITKGFVNWQVYGSRKPNHQAYLIKTHYELSRSDGYWEIEEKRIEDLSIEKNILKLSARYTHHPEFQLKEELIDEIETIKKDLNKKKTPKAAVAEASDSGYNSPTEDTKVFQPVNQNKKEDKWLDLLFNVIRNDVVNGNKVINRNNGFWTKIGGALLSNNYPKEIWLKYNKDVSNPKNNTASLLWDNMAKNPREVSIYSLCTIAKIVNLKGYNEWFIKNKQYISVSTLDKGENDIAQHIAPKLKEKMIYCFKNWYIYDRITNKWEVNEEPTGIVISHIQRSIDESRETLLNLMNRSEEGENKEKLKKKLNKYGDHYSQVTKGGTSTQIVKLLKTYLKDNSFIEKLDIKPFQVVYKNGILDLRTLKFKEGLEASDYITHYIDYN